MTCKLVEMSKTPDKEPNPNGSWGIGSYSTKGNGEAWTSLKDFLAWRAFNE
jgi:hypothetical protein